jgi:uncharacterized repeat protein (TIGR03803 family)
MPNKTPLAISFGVLAVIFGFLTTVAPVFAASHEKVLHTFRGNDGFQPQARLIFDTAGNLYGTTEFGGSGRCSNGCGTVFKLTPDAKGKWTQTVLHNFNGAPYDGNDPDALVIDPAGNLYGTTFYGGASGLGTLFKLTPHANGRWTETLLYSFCSVSGCKDGETPGNGLVWDREGNLYGTTGEGTNSYGTVFKFTPGAKGKSAYRVLYTFMSPQDGYPSNALTFDAAGNLYGATHYGGTYNYGTIFKLTPRAHGNWTKTILHNLKDVSGGEFPESGIVLDAAGNLYGTTSDGDTRDSGVVFQLAPGANGKWTYRAILLFDGLSGGALPGGVILDASGNLYGTTFRGGSSGSDCVGVGGCGVLFELTLVANGTWTENVLHNFCSSSGCTDGAAPDAAPIFDSLGNLYGPTFWGGDLSDCGGYGCGIVYEIKP